MSVSLLADQFQVPGIPASMALAAVALIGYLVGRNSRPAAKAQSSLDVTEALEDARQLEQIAEDVLSVTREALEKCRSLRLHVQAPAVMSPSRRTADYSAEGLAAPSGMISARAG